VTVNAGTVVDLSKSYPNKVGGYWFTGWSLTPGGQRVAQVTMDGNKTVYANYKLIDQFRHFFDRMLPESLRYGWLGKILGWILEWPLLGFLWGPWIGWPLLWK